MEGDFFQYNIYISLTSDEEKNSFTLKASNGYLSKITGKHFFVLLAYTTVSNDLHGFSKLRKQNIAYIFQIRNSQTHVHVMNVNRIEL